MKIIKHDLILRLLNIKEFYKQQYPTNYPNAHQEISELMNIKKMQLSLQEIINIQDILNNIEDGNNGQTGSSEDGTDGGGGTTIRGLRGKNDKRFKSPSMRKR